MGPHSRPLATASLTRPITNRGTAHLCVTHIQPSHEGVAVVKENMKETIRVLACCRYGVVFAMPLCFYVLGIPFAATMRQGPSGVTQSGNQGSFFWEKGKWKRRKRNGKFSDSPPKHRELPGLTNQHNNQSWDGLTVLAFVPPL